MNEIRNYLRIFLLSVLFILSYSNLLLSQESIDVSFNYGSVLVHSPEIEPISLNPVSGFAINYAFKNRMGERWRRFYNYPNYGINYIYKSYNDPDVLGSSHSVTSFLQLSFLKKRQYFDVGFKGMAGLGYFTKVYDPVTNPTNRAISAHLNITAGVRLYARVRFKPVFFEYSYGLNHSSNGLVKSPNVGINVLNNNFSLGYEFEDQVNKETIKAKERPLFIKNEFWGFVSAGIKILESNTDKYTFTNFSINYSKQVSVINKIGLGADFSHDPSLTPFAIETYGYAGDEDLSFRYGINIHNEFIMGNMGLFGAYGYYLRNSEFYPSNNYYKAGFRFYFNNIVGVILVRAIPLFRAEVIEFGLGYRITDKKYRNSKWK